MRVIDGEYVELRDDSLQVSRALVAGAGPLFPPAEWFKDPQFDRATPITVTADGRVKGHIAAWNTRHIGLPPPHNVPPHSRSDYAYFKTGVLRTDEGEDVQVGQLTLAGGHASLTASADDAVKHYDDTASAVADVTVGEDAYGIWVSGGLRPDVSDTQIRALRASAPSGDWRPINNELELVAICQVNTPGFPIARAMVASGEVTALVAAGAGHMYGLQQEASVYEELARQQRQIADLEEEVQTIVAGLKPKKAADEGEDAADEEWPDTDESAKDEPEPEKKAPTKPSNDAQEAERLRLREKFRKTARKSR